MSTELIAAQSTGAIQVFGQSEITEEQVDLIKRTIAKGASNDELSLFIGQCNRTQLDPFSRQIYCVARYDSKARKDVMQTQVSIDGLRLVAQRSSEYAGQVGPFWCGDDGEWLVTKEGKPKPWLSATPPAAAMVGVFRRGFVQELVAIATWEQYVQTYKKDGKTETGPMWKKMGPLMLGKCAEALALRKAFPMELSGLYTAEEMAQADNDRPAVGGVVPAAAAPLVSEPDQHEAFIATAHSDGIAQAPPSMVIEEPIVVQPTVRRESPNTRVQADTTGQGPGDFADVEDAVVVETVGTPRGQRTIEQLLITPFADMSESESIRLQDHLRAAGGDGVPVGEPVPQPDGTVLEDPTRPFTDTEPATEAELIAALDEANGVAESAAVELMERAFAPTPAEDAIRIGQREVNRLRALLSKQSPPITDKEETVKFLSQLAVRPLVAAKDLTVDEYIRIVTILSPPDNPVD